MVRSGHPRPRRRLTTPVVLPPDGLVLRALRDFAHDDPCGPVAHGLAVGEAWSPEQWNAAVDLVEALRREGLLPPLT